MLAPDDRALYTTCLEAPLGYRFDLGVATTFSLSLETLLVLPFTIATQRAEDPEALARDPVALLGSLQEITERLTVFCQEGYIHVPPREQLLFSLLEGCLMPARAPSQTGIFHPKLWLLRFVSEDEEERIILRAVVLSRNLTFDRSWDTALCLEGTPTGHPVKDSYGLRDMVSALPGLATEKLTSDRRAHIKLLAEEAAHTSFESPQPFRGQARFHAIGVEPGRDFQPSAPTWGRNILCVSPFLSTAAVDRAAGLAEQARTLISRDDQLMEVSDKALDRWDVQVLADAGDSDEGSGESIQSDDRAERVPAHGLHAKIVVLEHGHGGADATWWIGSANLGTAAWDGRNVELMAELQGRRRDVGIAKFLESGFQKMLESWQRTEPNAEEKAKREAIKKADEVRDAIAQSALALRCTGSEDQWDLALTGKLTFPEETKAHAWPVTLGEDKHGRDIIPLGRGEDVVWPAIASASVTALVAFSVTTVHEGAKATVRFALKLPHDGFPEDRHAHVIRNIVRSRRGFFRYLRLLLAVAEGDLGIAGLENDASRGANEGAGALLGFDFDEVVLEDLVRTLSRDPERLLVVDRLLDNLTSTEKGRALVPEDFLTLWETIRSVHRGEARP